MAEKGDAKMRPCSESYMYSSLKKIYLQKLNK